MPGPPTARYTALPVAATSNSGWSTGARHELRFPGPGSALRRPGVQTVIDARERPGEVEAGAVGAQRHAPHRAVRSAPGSQPGVMTPVPASTRATSRWRTRSRCRRTRRRRRASLPCRRRDRTRPPAVAVKAVSTVPSRCARRPGGPGSRRRAGGEVTADEHPAAAGRGLEGQDRSVGPGSLASSCRPGRSSERQKARAGSSLRSERQRHVQALRCAQSDKSCHRATVL